jgi:polyphenol oxidase
VFAADCLPVLITGERAVAAVHAGWRGLAQGVIAEGVRAVRELGGDGPLHGLVGPGARGCCYEAGEEVHAQFAGYDARVGERNLDLAAIARAQLAQAGAEVHDVGLCTICEPGLFFSHRRDNGVTGRQAGLVWRT